MELFLLPHFRELLFDHQSTKEPNCKETFRTENCQTDMLAIAAYLQEFSRICLSSTKHCLCVTAKMTSLAKCKIRLSECFHMAGFVTLIRPLLQKLKKVCQLSDTFPLLELLLTRTVCLSAR